ncbi:MAG TPA: AMP-dependent synthetase, partial [Ruminococcaceae bacterium]|nr:AMP-dependent synthetase [Oscillospiraceae bacterium]
MKFSFSTKGWHDISFEEFCTAAEYFKFEGIEPHNINNAAFSEKSGVFQDYSAAATLRMLYDRDLTLPCIDVINDIADEAQYDAAIAEIERCMRIAANLRIPNIRLRAEAHEDVDKAVKNAKHLIETILPDAEKDKISLLIETRGLYADTALLRDTLEYFASDYVAALWNMSAAYFTVGESPAKIISNLGAYVRHVHLNDAVKTDDGIEYRLVGEGDLPITETMKALRSVNYDGFISLVWDPTWEPDLDDMDIIFAQFISYMKQFADTSKNESALYWNNRHTGKFVWKKETLIDATFSDVLDRMVEEFPDQLAFKYTSLDYTRTYTEFRDDVDEFARVLISLGVKAGSHVAVWASNVPQWYIAFWATVKLGAVLVTVNTAYKIHEAEYLLKQSDTHTLIITQGAKDTSYGEIVARLCPELENVKEGEQLHAKRLPFLRNVITVGFEQKGCLTWEKAMGYAAKTPKSEVYRMAAQVDKDDVCNMQYTSGTTGFPKGVML